MPTTSKKAVRSAGKPRPRLSFMAKHRAKLEAETEKGLEELQSLARASRDLSHIVELLGHDSYHHVENLRALVKRNMYLTSMNIRSHRTIRNLTGVGT